MVSRIRCESSNGYDPEFDAEPQRTRRDGWYGQRQKPETGKLRPEGRSAEEESRQGRQGSQTGPAAGDNTCSRMQTPESIPESSPERHWRRYSKGQERHMGYTLLSGHGLQLVPPAAAVSATGRRRIFPSVCSSSLGRAPHRAGGYSPVPPTTGCGRVRRDGAEGDACAGRSLLHCSGR